MSYIDEGRIKRWVKGHKTAAAAIGIAVLLVLAGVVQTYL